MAPVFGLPLAAIFLAVALSLSPTFAFAGPLEDGVKAYSHADYPTAMKILMPLADKGNVDAQYSIALMYQKGLGVSEDKVRAHMWFSLASRDGDKDAAADRDQLAKDMTSQQITEAKQMATSWKPR